MKATDVLIGGLVKRLYAQRIYDVNQHRWGIARRTDEQRVRRLSGIALDATQTQNTLEHAVIEQLVATVYRRHTSGRFDRRRDGVRRDGDQAYLFVTENDRKSSTMTTSVLALQSLQPKLDSLVFVTKPQPRVQAVYTSTAVSWSSNVGS